MGLPATWRSELAAQIKALQKAPVQGLLQFLSDGIQEVIMGRPRDPFYYMAEYLRLAAMLIDEPDELTLSRELHKKQIILGRMRNDLSRLRARRLRALHACLDLEATLLVPDSILTDADRAFLDPEPRWLQNYWCPHTDVVATIAPPMMAFPAIESGNTRAIFECFVPECLQAIVELRKAQSDDPIRWLIAHFEAKSPQAQQRAQYVDQLKAVLGQYRLYYERMKVQPPQAEIDANRASCQRDDLQAQLSERTRLVTHISISKMRPRTQPRMTGKPVVFNLEKLWVPPENIEPIDDYTPFQLQALHRAERLVMEADEVRYKAVLRFDLEYYSARRIASMYRCHRAYAKYQILTARRNAAAASIQCVYEAYLYRKAVQLPPWCVLGQQVMVAMVLARRAAIWFEFYRGRDFPAGNFATDATKSLDELKTRCRHDDKCAAFASDGSLKRFVPRQLSQLQPLTKLGASTDDGLYIKRLPRSDADVIASAIVTSVPHNKFGTVEVVFDGTGVVEMVPVQKLSRRFAHEYDFGTDTWQYVDQVSRAQVATAPEPFTEATERQAIIDERKRLYTVAKDEAYKRKVEASAVKLQCAFRSKRARAKFRHLLEVRLKELEHQAIVDAAAAKVAEKTKKRWRRWFRWWS
ncbi:hypothetical protein SDRG_08084 [Saprolegnia diclina VS20]|uniref:Uncharacterized protein n=1 Tax=Saprolegnia diclina (strain VS20) TaxID=1156394 RepID=T0QHS9_SAPDV|nr:hypothetical protein SDRG_08084 [Saprolegnia diclina VS20]EQC34311.1 hypothetical protein SDRG_08084 [Saprolegnia diclina VS20]|eukprot:XP_008612173.1 hypothetical protein SDRG_08084 [Saprolegnia diclina VS20]